MPLPRFRLSLRILLLLVACCAVVLTVWMWPAMRERARSVAYERLKPRILKENKFAAKGDWYRDHIIWLAGLEPAFEMPYVSLKNATDADCAQLALLTELTTLELHDSQVTDAGLKHLAELTHLSDVIIEAPAVTDELATVLLNWPKLYSLDVSQTASGDRVVEVAHSLPNLFSVAGGRATTDKSLRFLLPQHYYIVLGGEEITGSALLDADVTKEVFYLDLPRAQLTPAAQAALVHFPNLNWLDIHSTKLDLSILPALSGKIHLDIAVDASHWSEADVQKLLQVFPDLANPDSHSSRYSHLPGRKGEYFGTFTTGPPPPPPIPTA